MCQRGVSPLRFLALTSAFFWSSRSIMSPDNAKCRGVLPSMSLLSTAAPLSSRSDTIVLLLLDAASCSGVCPFLFLTFGLDPFSSRARTQASSNLLHAACNGVSPLMSVAEKSSSRDKEVARLICELARWLQLVLNGPNLWCRAVDIEPFRI